MINVIIAGNQTLTQEGVVSVLSSVTNIVIVGFAETRQEVEEFSINFDVHAVIIDQHCIGNFTIKDSHKLDGIFNLARILIISDSHYKNEMLELIDQGVKNHISKECSREEFVEAVYATARTEQYFCSHTIQTLFGDRLASREIENIPMLSHREIEIIQLISVGLSNKEIAEKLFLSFHTIKTHRKNIIKKLGFTFKNASELAVLISYLNDIII